MIDILELKGQELTNLVVTKVMKWTNLELDNGYGYPANFWVDNDDNIKHPVSFWNPAYRIEDALEVAIKLGIAVIPQSQEDGSWRWYGVDIESVAYLGDEVAIVVPYNDSGVSAESMQLAICRASLFSILYH